MSTIHVPYVFIVALAVSTIHVPYVFIVALAVSTIHVPYVFIVALAVSTIHVSLRIVAAVPQPRQEAILLEVNVLKDDITYVLNHLDEWVKPEQVRRAG